MPLDPQARAVLEKRKSSGYPALNAESPLELKRESFNLTWREAGPEVHSVINRMIPGPDGDIPIRIYVPKSGGPFPALILFHGGGFVFGNIDTYDGNARRLAMGVGCIVISVGYRLAPEHKFPSAVEDSYSVTNWVFGNADKINVDKKKIAVGGDSAGANLATVVALMARDKDGPTLCLQVLVCPATDRNFPSANFDESEIPKGNKDWWWNEYLRDESDASHPYACPMQAESFDRLPEALVITSEFDELRDEGEAYAERLKQAGIATTCTRYTGMFHVFHMYPDSIEAARLALNQQCSALKNAFNL